MKIVITGGTGFVGAHLCRHCLGAGHEVTAIGSRPAFDGIHHSRFRYLAADTTRSGDWQTQVGAADLVYNLAGRNIFQRWTAAYKRQIYDSRILTTRNLVEALQTLGAATLISTSAVGYYGSSGDTELTEDSPRGDDFLAALARDWEAEAQRAASGGTRVVIARFSIVLGSDGGALAKMVPAFRAFLGGPLGSGRQWFPWIHIKDLLAAMAFLAERTDLHGPFNICAPHPVTNSQMARALGHVLERPARMAVPAFMLKMTMGELATALLSSQRAVPARLMSAGFEFGFPRVDRALADLLGSPTVVEAQDQ